jgi:hypothetical protein
VGLVRVSTAKQETARHHDALGPICVKVVEGRSAGSSRWTSGQELKLAIDHMSRSDILAVQEVDRLGRNLLEGLLVLNDLFERGITVQVLEGIAAGEDTECNLILRGRAEREWPCPERWGMSRTDERRHRRDQGTRGGPVCLPELCRERWAPRVASYRPLQYELIRR